MTKEQFVAAVQRLGYSRAAAEHKADSVAGLIQFRRRELMGELERLEADSYSDVLVVMESVQVPRA